MFKILGLSINNISLVEVLAKIREIIAKNDKALIVTANPEIIVYASKYQKYAEALKQARLIVPDGVGLILASYFLFHPLTKGRVTGINLVEEVIKYSGTMGYSVFLVGQNNDILQKATQYFGYKYTKINIVGYKVGPLFDSNTDFPINNKENNELLEEIKFKKPDILLVGFGHPKQEYWLNYYLPQLPCKIGIGVGGSFDYVAGFVQRSPVFLQKIGLEWLWRLFMQPWRIKRIFTAVIKFPMVVFIDRFTKLFHVEQS